MTDGIPSTASLLTDTEGPLTRRADRILMVGSVVLGTCILGFAGLISIALGFVLLRRAAAAGERQRPFPVTILAVFSLADACFYFVGWGLEIGANSTHFMQVFSNGFGRIIDGGYYIGYNTLLLGGSGAPGEKAWGMLCVFAIFPLRIVATWAFIKMKRWGYDFMIVTSWMYAFAWFGYLVNLSQDYENRFTTTEFGVVGWWIYNVWFITPFILLPWLYSLNRNKWNR